MHRFLIKPNTLEKIQAVRYSTKWKLGITTQIIADREQAINSIAQDDPDLKIFTDRSGMNRKIGVVWFFTETTD